MLLNRTKSGIFYLITVRSCHDIDCIGDLVWGFCFFASFRLNYYSGVLGTPGIPQDSREAIICSKFAPFNLCTTYDVPDLRELVNSGVQGLHGTIF